MVDARLSAQFRAAAGHIAASLTERGESRALPSCDGLFRGIAQSYSFMLPDDGAIANNPVFPGAVWTAGLAIWSALADPALADRGPIDPRRRLGPMLAEWAFIEFARITTPASTRRWAVATRLGERPHRRRTRRGLRPRNRATPRSAGGHRPSMLEAADDLLIVGAYPGEGVYDLCLGSPAPSQLSSPKCGSSIGWSGCSTTCHANIATMRTGFDETVAGIPAWNLSPSLRVLVAPGARTGQVGLCFYSRRNLLPE